MPRIAIKRPTDGERIAFWQPMTVDVMVRPSNNSRILSVSLLVEEGLIASVHRSIVAAPSSVAPSMVRYQLFGFGLLAAELTTRFRQTVYAASCRLLLHRQLSIQPSGCMPSLVARSLMNPCLELNSGTRDTSRLAKTRRK